jgi:hypothetical protein
MECRTCGRELNLSAKFCGGCGGAVPAAAPPPVSRADRGVAGGSPYGQTHAPDSELRRRGEPRTPGSGQAGSNTFAALLLAVTGLALAHGGTDLAYSFSDRLDSAKPALILLMVIASGMSCTAAMMTAGRARAPLTADGPVTASPLIFLVGALGGAFGIFRLLAALGQ